jgi:4a-hydroxytetrahydrobiopterin dehydratase
MAALRLEEGEIAGLLAALPGWTREGGRIRREYRFANFVEAWGFMSRAAIEIERLNHHPDWSNSWAVVRVELTTHDCGGLSARDFELASVLDRLAGA